MNDLLLELYLSGLTPRQVNQTFLTIDEWLEDTYPMLSQMYKKQLLQEVIELNKEQ